MEVSVEREILRLLRSHALPTIQIAYGVGTTNSSSDRLKLAII